MSKSTYYKSILLPLSLDAFLLLKVIFILSLLSLFLDIARSLLHLQRKTRLPVLIDAIKIQEKPLRPIHNLRGMLCELTTFTHALLLSLQILSNEECYVGRY